MNPLNLPGPEFLSLYIKAIIVAAGVAVLLRFGLPYIIGGSAEGSRTELDPYEVAYLAGGTKTAIQAAIASPAHKGAVTVNAVSRTLLVGKDLPPDAPDLETELYSQISPEYGRSINMIESGRSRVVDRICERLQRLKLVYNPGESALLRLIPSGIVAGVTVLGIIKIGVGLSRGRPVLYLVGLCGLAAVATYFFFKKPHRTQRGDEELASIKNDNAALETTAKRISDTLAGRDFALAVGLFGAGVLSGGALHQLNVAFQPPVSTGYGSGSGSSCSSCSSCGGSCGGGCGGGGCGGCG